MPSITLKSNDIDFYNEVKKELDKFPNKCNFLKLDIMDTRGNGDQQFLTIGCDSKSIVCDYNEGFQDIYDYKLYEIIINKFNKIKANILYVALDDLDDDDQFPSFIRKIFKNYKHKNVNYISLHTSKGMNYNGYLESPNPINKNFFNKMYIFGPELEGGSEDYIHSSLIKEYQKKYFD